MFPLTGVPFGVPIVESQPYGLTDKTCCNPATGGQISRNEAPVTNMTLELERFGKWRRRGSYCSGSSEQCQAGSLYACQSSFLCGFHVIALFG